MSKLKLLSIAVISLLLINIAIVGYLFFLKPPFPPNGRPPMCQYGGPPMKNEGPKKMIIERLHFYKEQVASYEMLIEAHKASLNSLNDSIKIAKNNLYQSLQNENFTGKDSLINLLGSLQKQIEILHFEHFAQLRKLCKPEQLKNFNELTVELAQFFTPDKKGPPPPKD